MGMSKPRREYQNHSAKVIKGQRWKALRLQALDRDGWACVQCGERRHLEVDHVLPVRDRPDLSFSLGNLQCLCGRCHSRKTRIDIGLGQADPKREAWKRMVRDLHRNPIDQRKDHD